MTTNLIPRYTPSAEELLNYDGYFFDFDGVILESSNIKTEAFGEMYRSVGIENQVIQYHLEHQGISRYEKFRWIAANLEGREISEEEVQEKGEQFTALVKHKILNAPYVAGIEALMDKLKHFDKKCIVASGTPEGELRDIVAERNMGHWFDDVHGSPTKKADIVEMICIKYRLRPERCLFFGDASTDYHAAKTAGTDFYARITPEIADFWVENTSKYMSDNFLGIF